MEKVFEILEIGMTDKEFWERVEELKKDVSEEWLENLKKEDPDLYEMYMNLFVYE